MDFKAHPGQRNSYKEKSIPTCDMFSITRPLQLFWQEETHI